MRLPLFQGCGQPGSPRDGCAKGQAACRPQGSTAQDGVNESCTEGVFSYFGMERTCLFKQIFMQIVYMFL